MRRYHFASARWFRLPLKAALIATSVFALMSIVPSLMEGTADEQRRALAGMVIVIGFVALGAGVTAGISDCTIELDDDMLYMRFESFFEIAVPRSAIAGATPIDPRPKWRYGFGASTNWHDRISCSHGGPLTRIDLLRPQEVRLWRRTVHLQTLWVGVPEQAAFVRDLGALSSEVERRAA